jgi:hypothetical protein
LGDNNWGTTIGENGVDSFSEELHGTGIEPAKGFKRDPARSKGEEQALMCHKQTNTRRCCILHDKAAFLKAHKIQILAHQIRIGMIAIHLSWLAGKNSRSVT